MTKHDNVSQGNMKATEFVKKFGLAKAKDALLFVPQWKHWFAEIMVKDNGCFVEMDAPVLRHEEGAELTSTFKLCEEWRPKFTKIKDLKRLVESHERVEFFGSLDDAIQIYEYSKDMEILSYGGREIPTKQLAQAIADVEACQ